MFPVEQLPGSTLDKAANENDLQVLSLAGAGDAFVGGFLYSLLNDGDLDSCVYMGHFAARQMILRPHSMVGFADAPSVHGPILRKMVDRRRDSIILPTD